MRSIGARNGSPSQPKAYPTTNMESEVPVPDMVAPATRKLIRPLIWNAKYWYPISQPKPYPAIDKECEILAPDSVTFVVRVYVFHAFFCPKRNAAIRRTNQPAGQPAFAPLSDALGAILRWTLKRRRSDGAHLRGGPGLRNLDVAHRRGDPRARPDGDTKAANS